MQSMWFEGAGHEAAVGEHQHYKADELCAFSAVEQIGNS
jgi:hypothetical protein